MNKEIWAIKKDGKYFTVLGGMQTWTANRMFAYSYTRDEAEALADNLGAVAVEMSKEE